MAKKNRRRHSGDKRLHSRIVHTMTIIVLGLIKCTLCVCSQQPNQTAPHTKMRPMTETVICSTTHLFGSVARARAPPLCKLRKVQRTVPSSTYTHMCTAALCHSFPNVAAVVAGEGRGRTTTSGVAAGRRAGTASPRVQHADKCVRMN